MNNSYQSKGVIERSIDLTKDGKTNRWDQLLTPETEEHWEELSKKDLEDILRRVCKINKIKLKRNSP